jgi:hypothetical protein
VIGSWLALVQGGDESRIVLTKPDEAGAGSSFQPNSVCNRRHGGPTAGPLRS